MKAAKLTLDPERFHNDGPFMSTFLSRYLDPNCKRMVNPYTASNRTPFACKRCCQFYCYDCIKNQKLALNFCLRCKSKLIIISVAGSGLDELLGFQVTCKNKSLGCKKSYMLKDEQTHMQFCRYNQIEDVDSDGSEDNVPDAADDINDLMMVTVANKFKINCRSELIKKDDKLTCTNKHELKFDSITITSPKSLLCIHCRASEDFPNGAVDGLGCDQCSEYICKKCNPHYVHADLVFTCSKDHTLVKQVVNIESKTFIECYECSEKYSTIQGNFSILACLLCSQFLCEKCQVQQLKAKEIVYEGAKIQQFCKNPSLRSQDQLKGAITCDQNHTVVKFFKINGKFEDYRCSKCLKRHLNSADGVLRCQNCSGYYLCPQCEETQLAAKAKKTEEVKCTTCQKAPKQDKKFQRILQCSSVSQHVLANLITNKERPCSLHCNSKLTEVQIGCDCGYGLCKVCCDQVTEANKVENPTFKSSKCVAGGHSLHTWVSDVGGECNVCTKTIPVFDDIVCCRPCNFWLCLDCAKNYEFGPLVQITCCAANNLPRFIPEISKTEYFCQFCQKNCPRTLPCYSHSCMHKMICDICVNTHIVSYLPMLTNGYSDFFFNKLVYCANNHLMVKLPNKDEFRKYTAKDDPQKRYPCGMCKKSRTQEEWFYHCTEENCNYDLCYACGDIVKVENHETYKALNQAATDKFKQEPTVITELQSKAEKTSTERLVDMCAPTKETIMPFYTKNKKICDYLLQKLILSQVEVVKENAPLQKLVASQAQSVFTANIINETQTKHGLDITKLVGTSLLQKGTIKDDGTNETKVKQGVEISKLIGATLINKVTEQVPLSTSTIITTKNDAVAPQNPLNIQPSILPKIAEVPVIKKLETKPSIPPSQNPLINQQSIPPKKVEVPVTKKLETKPSMPATSGNIFHQIFQLQPKAPDNDSNEELLDVDDNDFIVQNNNTFHL